MKEVVAAVEEVLREKGCGRVEMPPKRGVPSDARIGHQRNAGICAGVESSGH